MFQKIKDENGFLVDIEVEGMTKFSEKQKLFMFEVIHLMESVYPSAEFRNKATYSYMSHKEGKTPTEIYNIAMSSLSTYDRIDDHVIKLFVDLYDGKKSVLGYTEMHSGRIFSNRIYLETCIAMKRPWAYAGHVAHERMHTLGFKDRYPRKRQSVPYIYGRIMRILAQRVYEGQNLSRIRK